MESNESQMPLEPDHGKLNVDSENIEVLESLKEALGEASDDEAIDYLIKRFGWQAVEDLRNSN